MLDGDLLEVEARFYIESGGVLADFDVRWRHPEQGVGGVYRGALSGFSADTRFDTDLLARLSEDVVGDAARDFHEDGARFARDLRTALVRDTTDPITRAALDTGPPYPEQSGRAIHIARHADAGPPPGWERVSELGDLDGFAEPEILRRTTPLDES